MRNTGNKLEKKLVKKRGEKRKIIKSNSEKNWKKTYGNRGKITLINHKVGQKLGKTHKEKVGDKIETKAKSTRTLKQTRTKPGKN